MLTVKAVWHMGINLFTEFVSGSRNTEKSYYEKEDRTLGS
mgnify:CR=1 FL=1